MDAEECANTLTKGGVVYVMTTIALSQPTGEGSPLPAFIQDFEDVFSEKDAGIPAPHADHDHAISSLQLPTNEGVRLILQLARLFLTLYTSLHRSSTFIHPPRLSGRVST